MKKTTIALLVAGLSFVTFVGCGGDDDSDADKVGIGAMCEKTSDCPEVVIDDEDTQLSCLTQFGGGYCAIEDCDSAADCPGGSTCVAHDDGKNYCFLDCKEKTECNSHRDEDNQSNCSANFDFAEEDDDDGQKACIPPSSGDGAGGAGGDKGKK